MAGLFPLVLNPKAWIAVGVALFLGFSGGVVKGWNASNADYLRQQVAQLKESAKRNAAIITANEERYLQSQAEKTRLENDLRTLINETPDSCVLSDTELSRLRNLSAS